MNAVMYGAGNIGRGFIGLLFSKAGYKVTFIDAAADIVSGLNEGGFYPVRLLSNEKVEEFWITGVKAVNGANEQEVADCIAEADIMATAVGVKMLPSVAPLIAGGLRKRFRLNAAPLNIILSENLIGAGKYLADLVKENLDAGEIKQLEGKVGFVEASIGCMVPIQTPEMQDGNILRVCSEKYMFLPVNKDTFVGEIPKIEGMAPFSNFDFFVQRKLFIHNMGLAVCAYLGLLLGDNYIFEAAGRADILFIVQNAMLESASALRKKFNIQPQDLLDHMRDLLCRFNNRALKDTCARIAVDIERKLSSGERIIGAIVCCREQDVQPAFISIGAAAALHYIIKERGLEQEEGNALALIKKVSGLEKHSDEARFILDMYLKIQRGDKLAELIQSALFAGNKPGVI